MRLQFLGAAGTVTGSKYLVTVNSNGHTTRLLVDCGLYQGIKNLRQRNRAVCPVDPHQLNAVILTHAHIDHSGYLPALVKAGYRGPVYCTQATRDLCRILLPDSAHLQEEDAEYANRKGFSRHAPATPLYTLQDAETALKLLHGIAFHTAFAIKPDIHLRFSHAGHIPGAACVQLNTPEGTLTFSGDVGRPNDVMMQPPEALQKTDWLVLESTYGNRLHTEEDIEQRLTDIITHTLAHGGTVLLPAFAVGRAQMALHLIARLLETRRIPHVPVYLNSPMAVSATELLFAYPDEHRLSQEDIAAIDRHTTCIRSKEESIELVRKHGPMIIISASGMASGGRVLHHLKALLPDTRNSVIFLGYQAPGTRGDALINGSESVKIHGEWHPVRARIHHIDSLSAHADYSEILQWLRHLPAPPQHTFITHGEPAAADALRLRLQDELGWSASVPEFEDVERLGE